MYRSLMPGAQLMSLLSSHIIPAPACSALRRLRLKTTISDRADRYQHDEPQNHFWDLEATGGEVIRMISLVPPIRIRRLQLYRGLAQFR